MNRKRFQAIASLGFALILSWTQHGRRGHRIVKCCIRVWLRSSSTL